VLTGRRFLIYAQGGYSDRLRAVPFLRALWNANQGGSVAMLGYESGRELWEACPYVDEFIAMGAGPVLGRGHRTNLRKASLAVRVGIRRRGCHDVFLNLSVMPEGLFPALLSVAAGIPVRVGYGNPRAGVTRSAGPADMRVPFENRAAALLALVGVEVTDFSLEAWCSDEDRAEVDGLLAATMAKGKRVVVCHPTSDWSCQMWPAERWAEVIDGLVMRHQCQVVLTGLAEERGFRDEIVARLSVPVTDLVGRTSHGRLAALLERADLVVTLDTLVAPLARAMGAELVTLMSTDTPNWTQQRLLELGSLGMEDGTAGTQSWSVLCKWRRTGVVERCQSHSCIGVHGMGRIRSEAVLARITAKLERVPLAMASPIPEHQS
jgi:ADP-heptose:LPS heptosyltransferase